MQIKRPKGRRELYERLEAQRQSMREASSTLPPEEKKQRLAQCEIDPCFFYRTYLPHYLSQESPKFHHELREEAGKPGINGLAAPRGFAKSTLITTAETLLRVCVPPYTWFQIVVKETEDAAIDEVASIQLELEENPRIIADFGSLKKHGDWEDGDFTTTTGCRVLALGVGQSIRGKRHRQHRPGRVIIDDPEKDKNVKNPRLSKERVDWVMEAVYPSLEPITGICTWLGTMISRRSGLAMLQKREGVNRRIWAALDSEGHSIWPERFSDETLAATRIKVGPKAWRQEYMNNPADDPDATFQDYMIKRFKREELIGAKITGVFTACDPSLEATVKHCFKAIITVLKVSEFRGLPGPYYLIIDAWLKQTTLDRMFNAFFAINEKFRPTKMGLEIQCWQKLLMRDVRAQEQQRQVRLPITGITHSTEKEARIARLQPIMERGFLLFLDDPESIDLTELIDQFLGFDEPSIFVDGPDATEMAVELAERAGRKIGKVRTW